MTCMLLSAKQTRRKPKPTSHLAPSEHDISYIQSQNEHMHHPPNLTEHLIASIIPFPTCNVISSTKIPTQSTCTWPGPIPSFVHKPHPLEKGISLPPIPRRRTTSRHLLKLHLPRIHLPELLRQRLQLLGRFPFRLPFPPNSLAFFLLRRISVGQVLGE